MTPTYNDPGSSKSASGHDVIDSRCRFCGKSRSAVRTLVVSAESAICDECIIAGLDAISRRRGHLYLRIPFLFFRAIASVGYSVAYISGVVTSVVYRLIRKIR